MFPYVLTFLLDSAVVLETKGENQFHMQDGDTADYLTISVTMFNILSELYDRYLNESSPKYIFTSEDLLYEDINKILEQHSPSTLKLIQSYGVKSYNFLLPTIFSFFTSGRVQNEAEYLFTAFISSRDPVDYVECIIASSFILLHKRLSLLNLAQTDAFQEAYTAFLMKIDARLLISNTTNLENMLYDNESEDSESH